MKKILVPISFSEKSQNALTHAYAIAKQYDVKLDLLHCYPQEDYNREYDFGIENYDKGIRRMLVDFYNQCLKPTEKPKINIITHSGSVSDIIYKISPQYDLVVMKREIGPMQKSNSYFSDKLFYISSKSGCPVLITSTSQKDFSFHKISNIWHIKRKETESKIVQDELVNFGIDSNIVVTKSLVQENFVSIFWKNIITYSKTHNKSLLKDISQSFEEEQIDLLILVNHLKGMFELFMKYDAFQIISQFDIPILIFQNKSEE